MIRCYNHPTPNPAKIALLRGDGVAPAAVGQRDISSYCTVSAAGRRRSLYPKREENEDGA